MKSRALALVVLLVLMAAPRLAAQPAPTLTTDKPSYEAGEVITFRGENWSPGESVTIVVSGDGSSDRATLRAVADDAGAFSVTATMPGDDEESATRVTTAAKVTVLAIHGASEHANFHAVANGNLSQATAQAQFGEGEIETDGEHLLELEDYWNQRLTFPTGHFNPAWVRKAAEQDKHVPRGTPKGKKRGKDGKVGGMSAGRVSPLALNDAGFTPLGPQPERMTGCASCFNYSTTAGRINNIAVDPTTTTPGSIVAYAASVGGGVWKTTNCCSSTTTWSVLTDDPLIATTSIDSVTLDPNDHNTVYAGTGDLNYGSFSMGSQGILKSTDAGAHWTVLGADIFGPALAQPAGQFPQYQAVGKVRVDPNNGNRVVAGAKTGLYFSYDGGANWTGPCLTNPFATMRQDITALELTDMGGGVTRILAAVGVRGFATVVQFNLNQNGANGIYTATMPASGCPGFTSIAGNANGFRYQATATAAYAANANMNAASGAAYVNATTGNQLGRIELAVAPTDPNVIYAQVQSITPNNDSGCGNVSGCQLGVWVTTNGGASWSFMAGSAGFSLTECTGGAGGGDYPQNWYDQAVAVDPNNPDRIFVSTFDVWFATRTGTAFNDVTCGYSYSGSAGPVHTDQHALAFVPGSSSMLLLGNDGGVHGTTNASAATSAADPTWFNMDAGLNTIEFYSGDISGDFANSATPQASGGAQDNGPSSVRFSGSPTGPAQWQMGLGGDGFYSRIDPVGTGTSLRFWQGNNSGGLSRCIGQTSTGVPRPCTDSGATWNSKRGAWTGDTQSFVLPFDIFRGGIPGGDDCPTAAPNGGCGHLIAGTTRVWETILGNAANTNGTVTWVVTNNPTTQNLTKGTLGSRSYINQVKYSPKKQSIAIAGTSDGNVQIGFNLGTGTAAQATWVNVTGGNAVLPNRPVLGIALDPTTTTAPIGYAAVGGFNANSPATPGHVFRVVCNTNCASFSWTDKSGNLPDIPVDSIIANPNFPPQVFAGTDFGLYYTDDITANPPVWQRFTSGLPNVMIWDMQIDRGSTTLSLWTRSRGAYVWPLPLGPENPLPATLDVPSASGVYGGTVTLSATMTSGGNPVPGKSITFSLNGTAVGSATTDGSGTATLSDASLASIHAGTYNGGITVAFTGDDMYADVADAETLTVARRPITVSAVADAKVYDGTTSSAATPLLAPGLVGSDTPAFIQTFDTKSAGSGKHLIPSGAVNDGNGGNDYAVTFLDNHDGAISPKTLTGSVAVANKEYDGTAAATITSRVLAGVVTGDAVSYSGGTAAFSDKNAGAAKSVTAAGLALTGADAGNYTVNSTAATTADITKAPLTVTAVGAARLYSYPNPSFSASYSGFENGETLATSGVTGAPSLATAATQYSAAGSYPIVAGAGTLSANNYAFAFVDGTLNVLLSGIVGLDSLFIGSNKALADSFDSAGGYPATAGAGAILLSNGPIDISGATVAGNVVSAQGSVALGPGSSVSGSVTAATSISAHGSAGSSTANQPSGAITAAPVAPCGAYTLAPALSGGHFTYSNGDLAVSGNGAVTIADGTYCFHSVTISGNASLQADGAVVINMTGVLGAGGGSLVNTTRIPSNLQIASSYSGADGVTISGNTQAYLTVYAPGTDVTVTGGSPVFGALLGKTLTISGNSQVHYDTRLPQIWVGFGF